MAEEVRKQEGTENPHTPDSCPLNTWLQKDYRVTLQREINNKNRFTSDRVST